MEDSDVSSAIDRLEEQRISSISGGLLDFFRPLVLLYFKIWPKAQKHPDIIQCLLSEIDPSLRYKPDGLIRKKEFVSSELYNNPVAKYWGCDLITGKIGSTDIRFSMAHAEEKCQREVTDSKGRKKTETYYVTFFEGVLFSADFNKNITGMTVVRSSRIFGRGNVKLEDSRFNKLFGVTSSDQIEARYILSHSLMEKIVEIRNRFGEINLSFTGEHVLLALPMSAKLLDLNMGSAETIHSQVDKIYAKLASIVGLVDDLDLNTRIWTKK